MKTKIKKLTTILALAASLFSAQAQEKKETKAGVSANVSTSLLSDYVARPGFIVGKGPVSQSSISATISRSDIGSLTGFFWQNHDWGLKKDTERDYGIRFATKPIAYGNSSFSARISYQAWEFPIPNVLDQVIEPGVHYSLKLPEGKKWMRSLELDTTATYLLPQSNTPSGVMSHSTLALDLTKKSEKGKWSTTVSPLLQTAVVKDFYGASGITHLTPGAKISFSKGRFSLDFFGKYQMGMKEGFEDVWYGGVGVNVNFRKKR